MNKIILLIALTFSWLTNIAAQKQKLYDLFDKYQEIEGVTSIKIAKPMFGMLSKLDLQDAELDNIKPMLNKIEGLRILVIEKPKQDSLKKNTAKDLTQQLLDFNNLQTEISTSVKNLNYEELIAVTSKDNKIRFLASDASDGNLDNLLLSINAADNTVLMMLDGQISMEDVNNLASEAQNREIQKMRNDVKSASSSELRKVGKFSGIKVSSGINLTFTQDNNQKVEVDVAGADSKYVITEVEGDILKVYVESPNNTGLKFSKLNVKVSAPELSKISVNAGANFVTANTVKADYFQIANSSGGMLKADLQTSGKAEISATSGATTRLSINASSMEISATSGSTTSLKGNIPETSFAVSSAAQVDSQELLSTNTKIEASSAADLKVNVQKEINANISSGAKVRYRKNEGVQRNAEINGGGSLKPL